jgi:hypothetical protein
LFFDRFDFLKGIKLSAIDARTARRGHVPLVDRMQVKRPERPSTALVGADRINRTPAAAVLLGGQEDTVFGGAVFLDAVFEPDAFEVFFFRLFDGDAQMFGKKLDLRLRDPDIALFGPRTAIAAAGAFKMQSTLVPFIIRLQDSVLSL